jgi:DNA processing protein
METLEALVALNLISGVGPIRIRHLLDHFGGDPAAVLSASQGELDRVPGIGGQLSSCIAGWQSGVDLSGELRRIQETGVTVLGFTDAEYPALLKQIYDPPPVLYVKGRLTAEDGQGVAVVGSRLTTSYGMEVARKLGYQLAYTGVSVISGGARGADTAAHQGALSAQGRTIAVLGTGIDRVYPSENGDLFERIAERGALMTQFPFGRSADRGTFPARNRIVAGMSLGTVVIEASLSSGALITANLANDYGRQVFAVPGRIDSPRSKGCHDLIKKGAKLCEGIEDVLSEFEYRFPASNRPELASGQQEFPSITLTASEQAVWDALGRETLEVDPIIRGSGLPPSAVQVALFSLELKRLVRQLPGRRFERVSSEN